MSQNEKIEVPPGFEPGLSVLETDVLTATPQDPLPSNDLNINFLGMILESISNVNKI